MSKVDVCVTIDTENPQTPLFEKRFSDNRLYSDDWGIEKICTVLNNAGVRASFFLNVYEYTVWGRSELTSIAKLIHDFGHDVELHTHPIWIDRLCRENMFQFSLEEQRNIIRWGADFIEKATGRRPRIHRAGAYGYNLDTLRALSECGFVADSSNYYGHPFSRCMLTRNCPVESHGIMELPVSMTTGVDGNIRKCDLDVMTEDEVNQFVLNARDNGIGYVNYMFHSYSLTKTLDKFASFQPAPEKVVRLEATLKRLQEIEGVTVGSMAMFMGEENC